MLKFYSRKVMQETQLTSDTYMHDWFPERDVKMPQVILHDKLMTDALLGIPIKTEHSYSLNSDGDSMPESPRSLKTKMEDMDDDCYPVITMTARQHIQNRNTSNSVQSVCSTNDSSSISSSDIDVDDSNVKEEPLSPSSSNPPSPCAGSYEINSNLANMAAYTNTDLVFEHKNGSLQLSPASQSLLKNQHIIIGSTQKQQIIQAQQTLIQSQQLTQNQRIVTPKLNIKMEPQLSTFGLPPTPPSSLSSDDSEGNQSPEHHSSPLSPPAPVLSSRRTPSSIQGGQNTNSTSRAYTGTSSRQPIHTPLISSQPKGSTGSLLLTEEEKRTLIAEGYPIPTRLPLTKAEEKSLKKIRRKIKNKISAQESRRKKKEYVDQLERKVEVVTSENTDCRKQLVEHRKREVEYVKQVEALSGENFEYRKQVEEYRKRDTESRKEMEALRSQLAKLQTFLSKQKMKKI
ncbi:hypothetical protein HA402_002271 [Bradysia odoriphaga]|nr:hypothetical protein HA402_002271 [Bradysia odoriphaga]